MKTRNAMRSNGPQKQVRMSYGAQGRHECRKAPQWMAEVGILTDLTEVYKATLLA